MKLSNSAANGKLDDARIIALVGLAHASSHFFHLILVPLFPWIKSAFDLSYSELGLLVTVFFVASALVQTAAGFAVDKVGPYPVLVTGVSCLALSALTLALSPSYPWLIVGAAIAGTGNGVFHPCDYSLLNHRITTSRLAYAFSIHGVSGNLGWAAAPIFLISITQLTNNWRVALLGACALACVVLTLLILNRRQLGLRPAGPGDGKVDTAHGAVSAKAASTFTFLKLPQVWMCWGFMFLTTMALAGFQSFAPLSLTQMYGMPLAMATASYTAYMLASAGGMLLGGYANARVNSPDRLILVCFVFAGLIAMLVASAVLPAATVPLLMGAIGFGSGVAQPSRDLLVRLAAPEGALGRVYGIVYSGLDIGMAVGPVIYGVLMDHKYPNMVFVVIGVFQMLSILTAISVGGGNRRRSVTAATA